MQSLGFWDPASEKGEGVATMSLDIGQRIEVLFDDPPQYFAGTITGKTEGKYVIEYDDGEREEADLDSQSEEKTIYRLLESRENRSSLRRQRSAALDVDPREKTESEEVVEDTEGEEEALCTRKRYRSRARNERRQRRQQIPESTSECVDDSQDEGDLSGEAKLSSRKRYRRIALKSTRRSTEVPKPAKSSQSLSKVDSTFDPSTLDVRKEAAQSNSPDDDFALQNDCVLETQIISQGPKGTQRNSEGPLTTPDCTNRHMPEASARLEPSSAKDERMVEIAQEMDVLPTPGKPSMHGVQEDYNCVPESPYSQDVSAFRQTIEESPAVQENTPKPIAETPEQEIKEASHLHAHEARPFPASPSKGRGKRNSTQVTQEKSISVPKTDILVQKQCDVLEDRTNLDAGRGGSDNAKNGVSSLFQFASGKPVHISEESLKKAKSVFDTECDGGDVVLDTSPYKTNHEVLGKAFDGSRIFEKHFDKCFEEILSERSQLYPVFDLSTGVNNRHKGKAFYALKYSHDGEKISYEDLEIMNKKVKWNQMHPDEDSGDIAALVERSRCSCAHLCGASEKRLILEDDFLRWMRVEGFNLCTIEWVRHHCKMITFSILKLELQFPELFKNRILCAEAVYRKLCQRYKREFVQKKWPCLQKILMREVSSSDAMVLLVTQIKSVNTVQLSDGWYTISAHLDKLLCLKMGLGQIFVGKKLLVSMCDLRNSHQPCHPLEVEQGTFLALNCNSVFPAKKGAKLGFARRRVPLVSLPQIEPSGGLVPSTIVLIEKQYPMVYMEKLSDGRGFLKRNEASEHKAKDDFDFKRERIKEDIQERMQNQCSEEDLICQETTDRLERDFNLAVAKTFAENNVLERHVSALLNLRVSQVVPPHKMMANHLGPPAAQRRGAVISLWRPSEELKDLLRPGQILRISNLMAKSVGACPSGMIHLDCIKSTRFHPMGNMSEQKASLHFEMGNNSCDSVESLSMTRERGREFDFSGVLIRSERTNEADFSVFVVSQSELRKGLPWLLRVTVGAQCTGLGNLAKTRFGESLSFQNLSFDFTDHTNMVVNSRAGIQSICAPKMIKRTASLADSEHSLALDQLKDRVDRLHD